jgi:hypothetical protein
MPILTPDTSEAEDFSTPIDPGTYPAHIVACESGKSKAGNDKIVPKFKIKVGDGERTRKAHLVITGEGAMGFDQLLRATRMGELADAYRDKALKTKPPFNTDSLIGKSVMVVIGPNIYKNDSGVEVKGDSIDGYLPA